jgi:ferredoxin
LYNVLGLHDGEAAAFFILRPCKDSLSMPKVTFVKEKKEVEVPVGANLRLEALKAGVSVYPPLNHYLNCRGFGLCGTCRVLVKKGMENLNAKTLMERINLNAHPLTMLAVIGHENEMRLSCQVQVNGDCTIETKPAFNLNGENFWQKPYPNK